MIASDIAALRNVIRLCSEPLGVAARITKCHSEKCAVDNGVHGGTAASLRRRNSGQEVLGRRQVRQQDDFSGRALPLRGKNARRIFEGTSECVTSDFNVPDILFIPEMTIF